MAELSQSADLTLPSDLSEARQFQDAIEAKLQAFGFSEREVFGIKLALEEALVNAIKHGNKLDPAKRVHILYSLTAEQFAIRIRDEGAGFNPEDVPDPTAPENLERPCGRGLLLMRHYMTEVEYSDRGRQVSMSKLRNGTH